MRDKGRRRRRGSTLVESALILTVFISMCIGIMDFAQFLYVQQSLVERARQAARLAIVNDYTTTQVVNQILYDSPTVPSGPPPGRFGLTAANVTAAYAGAGTAEQRLVISIRNLRYSILSPFIAGTAKNLPIILSIPTEAP
jgi:hypothetical protein